MSSHVTTPKNFDEYRPHRNFCVIDPTVSTWFDFWDVQMVVMLVFTAFLSPYESAFSHSVVDFPFFFDRISDFLFIVDTVLQFFLAYPDPRNPERLVKVHRQIVLHYLKGWFLVDMMSLLPSFLYLYGLVRQNDLHPKGGMTLEVLRIIRLVRLLRLLRFTAIFDRWSTSFGFSYASLSLMKFFTLVIFCCHWTACLWGGYALHRERYGEVNWLAALRAAKGGEETMYTHHKEVYGLALYWAIVTLTSIGYGDITPQGGWEYTIATFCTAIMAASWAYVIGSVCTIVSTLQPHEVHFKRSMDDLNWLLSDRRIPSDMCKSLRRYFHEAREMNKQRVEESIINQMSPMLQGKFSMHLHQKWISKVWYLEDMHREIIVWAARNLKLMIYAPGEDILEERTLFIVRRGMCAHRGRILSSGDIWGEDMLLSNDVLRDKNKARALSYLSTLRLHIADLFEIVTAFPEAKQRLRLAQVKIATMRGINLLSKTITLLHARGVLDLASISEEGRCRLYADILNGRFDEEDLAQYQSEDDDDAEEQAYGSASRSFEVHCSDVMDIRQNARAARQHSNLNMLAGAGPSRQTTMAVLDKLAPQNGRKFEKPSTSQDHQGDGGSSGPQLMHLIMLVEGLKDSMVRLEARVEGMEGRGRRPSSRGGPVMSHRSSFADSCTEIDFGPLRFASDKAQGGRSKSGEGTGSVSLSSAARRRLSWYDAVDSVSFAR